MTVPSFSEKPSRVTIARAILVTCWMSPAAPEVTLSLPNTSSSATRPPIDMASMAISCSKLCEIWSRSGSDWTMPSARPRGMMVALWIGVEAGIDTETRAWPAS